MIFTEPVFLIFFALVFAAYWFVKADFSFSLGPLRLTGHEVRLTILLLASAVFYGWWDWRFLGLIGFVILVSWVSAIRASGGTLGRGSGKWAVAGLGLWLGCSLVVALGKMPVLGLPVIGDLGVQLSVMTRASWAVAGVMAIALAGAALSVRFSRYSPRKVFWTAFAIISQLGVLALFKYFGFFSDSAAATLTAMGLTPSWPMLNILLPVGISFYIFQAISYIVDTARGDLAPEKRIRRVALYIAFFPQLVAGPIVRAASFFPQMERAKSLSGALVASGVRAFLIGFAYKAGIADNLAPLVDPVYSGGELVAWSNSALIGATLAFGGQIYFDFAGYSLMAIGVARLFGFHIPKNFDYPYAALSIADFWRRWHISLSSWLRDYLYIPLGGNRGGDAMTYRNLMATMVLGGLWHGAAWTFVAWGAMHGAALVVHRALFGSTRRKIGTVLALIATQGFVLLTWAAFRAEDFGDMATVWYAFTGLRDGGAQMLPWFVWLVPGLIALDAILGLKGRKIVAALPALRQPVVYWGGLGALAGVLLALYPLEAAPFVYFQF